jgi:HSP20 family protein
MSQQPQSSSWRWQHVQQRPSQHSIQQPQQWSHQAPAPQQLVDTARQAAPRQVQSAQPLQGQTRPQGQRYGQQAMSGQRAQQGAADRWSPATVEAQPQAQVPPVDVLETPAELLVLVDMAGFDEDDIQLDIDNDVLRIAASRTLEIDDDETLLAQERPTRFERYLQLPMEANIEEARAKQEDGVCRITLPKSESAQSNHHRIGFQ